MTTKTLYKVMEVGIFVFWPENFETAEAAQAAIDARDDADEFQVATITLEDPDERWNAVLAKRTADEVAAMSDDQKARKLAEAKAILAALEGVN